MLGAVKSGMRPHLSSRIRKKREGEGDIQGEKTEQTRYNFPQKKWARRHSRKNVHCKGEWRKARILSQRVRLEGKKKRGNRCSLIEAFHFHYKRRGPRPGGGLENPGAWKGALVG